MKSRFLVFLCLSVSCISIAQPRQRAEKAFVDDLNTILVRSVAEHNKDGAEQTEIDSVFAISPAGMLSLTIRTGSDSSVVVSRMEASLYKLSEVVLDVYLSLRFEGGTNRFVKTASGWQPDGTDTLFFVGDVHDEVAEWKRVNKHWEKLKRWYRK